MERPVQQSPPGTTQPRSQRPRYAPDPGTACHPARVRTGCAALPELCPGTSLPAARLLHHQVEAVAPQLAAGEEWGGGGCAQNSILRNQNTSTTTSSTMAKGAYFRMSACSMGGIVRCWAPGPGSTPPVCSRLQAVLLASHLSM